LAETAKPLEEEKLTMHKQWFIPALACAFALFILQTRSALACGGLIAPDGDVRLARASTLIAWHGGIEHYLTSFSYQGAEKDVGWIVPLPAVPEKIEAGGAWTLQRLSRESHPVPFNLLVGADADPSSAQVLQQVQVEALNVTVIRGSGAEIVDWASQNGFFLNEDTRAHLLAYAKGSPIFMAAKYDTRRAAERHQLQGDGVPLLITMRTRRPWVPLEVLALDGQQVQADLYFLTDMPLNTSELNAKFGQSAVGRGLPGAPGFKVAFQERMNALLYQDLSRDRNMSWVRPDGWFTYLSLDAPSEQVRYDLGIDDAGVFHLAPFGTPPMAVADRTRLHELPSWIPRLPMNTPQWAEGSLVLILVACLTLRIARRVRSTRKKPGRETPSYS
jgi:Uncharacterized protein conserved in bacteria (DUF2330)